MVPAHCFAEFCCEKEKFYCNLCQKSPGIVAQTQGTQMFLPSKMLLSEYKNFSKLKLQQKRLRVLHCWMLGTLTFHTLLECIIHI